MHLSLKIRRPSLKIRKLSTKLDFHQMTVFPVLLSMPLGIFVSMALADLGMQTLSYLVFGLFLIGFAVMALLYIKDREMSKYGMLHLLFFLILFSLTAINSDADTKNCLYIALEVLMFLMMFHYYRNRIHVVIISIAIVFSFCVYAGLLHMLAHPNLWIIAEDKADTGYLLGNNYNGMGMRMIVAMAYSAMCTKYSKLWRINFIGVTIATFVPILITGSKTSLAGIGLFTFVYILPSLKIQKSIANVALTAFLFFQCFVVFSGKGLENNELAVYIIEDLLDKDITFTYRTYLWDTAIQEIAKSPIWGYGFVNMDWYATHISIQYGTGPHNMILSVLVNGGIILFLIYMAITTISLANVFSYNDRHAVMARMSVIATMIMLLMEFQSYTFIMLLFALAYYYPVINKEHKENFLQAHHLNR